MRLNPGTLALGILLALAVLWTSQRHPPEVHFRDPGPSVERPVSP